MDKRTASRIRRTNGVSRFQNGISTTLAGLTCNISVVDGTAFVTNPSVDLTPYLGCRITLVDTAGLSLIGWVKAKGTGETVGDDLLSGWDFTSGWVEAGAKIADANTFSTASSGGVYSAPLMDGRKLYTLSGETSQSTMRWYNGTTSGGVLFGIGADTFYQTNNGVSGRVLLYNPSALSTDIAAMTLKQVLTPSATGVTITNSPGGSVFNWAAKHPSFNPNSATFNAIIRA